MCYSLDVSVLFGRSAALVVITPFLLIHLQELIWFLLSPWPVTSSLLQNCPFFLCLFSEGSLAAALRIWMAVMPGEAGNVYLTLEGDGTSRQAKALWTYAVGTAELGRRPQQQKEHRKPGHKKANLRTLVHLLSPCFTDPTCWYAESHTAFCGQGVDHRA